jgi:hypothetical protein
MPQKGSENVVRTWCRQIDKINKDQTSGDKGYKGSETKSKRIIQDHRKINSAATDSNSSLIS